MEEYLTGNEDEQMIVLKTAIHSVLSSCLVSVNKNIQSVGEKIDAIKFRVDNIEQTLDSTVDDIKSLKSDLKTVTNDLRTLGKNSDALHDENTDLKADIFKLLNKNLEADVYSRKKNVIISGVPGKAGEESDETRRVAEKIIYEVLGYPDHKDISLSKVHRLNSKKNDSGIICAINNLNDTDFIMDHATKLKSYNSTNGLRISVQIQTHPVLIDLRKELLTKRKDMEGKSHVKHIPTFPFFGLYRKDQATIYPSCTKNELLLKYKNFGN